MEETVSILFILIFIVFSLLSIVIAFSTLAIAFREGGCLSLFLAFFFSGISQFYYFIVLWTREGFGLYQFGVICQIMLGILLFFFANISGYNDNVELNKKITTNSSSTSTTILLNNFFKSIKQQSSKGESNTAVVKTSKISSIKDLKTYKDNIKHLIDSNKNFSAYVIVALAKSKYPGKFSDSPKVSSICIRASDKNTVVLTYYDNSLSARAKEILKTKRK